MLRHPDKPKQLYRQCTLRKKTSTGYAEMVSHIPKKFAKVGEVLKLMQSNGTWDDGWVVQSAGELAERPDWRKSIRTHRGNTGDSLPKTGA